VKPTYRRGRTQYNKRRKSREKGNGGFGDHTRANKGKERNGLMGKTEKDRKKTGDKRTEVHSLSKKDNPQSRDGQNSTQENKTSVKSLRTVRGEKKKQATTSTKKKKKRARGGNK